MTETRPVGHGHPVPDLGSLHGPTLNPGAEAPVGGTAVTQGSAASVTTQTNTCHITSSQTGKTEYKYSTAVSATSSLTGSNRNWCNLRLNTLKRL